MKKLKFIWLHVDYMYKFVATRMFIVYIMKCKVYLLKYVDFQIVFT